MKETDKTIFDAVKLLREGKKNEACGIVFEKFENDIIRYLIRTYGWDEEEAKSIFYDAYLLLQDKLINNEIDTFNKTYLVKICKNIGANEYRKVRTQKTKFNQFIIEAKCRFDEEIRDYAGITIWDNQEEIDCENTNYNKALRAFTMLGEKCRKILELKFIDNQSHKDIASKIEGINTERSSITTMKRCLQKWKAFIAEM